jgi:MFS transporter, DHA1 family, multidrug resistance protein
MLLKNKSLAILFFTMVVMMLGFGIIIPIIPFYIEIFGAGGLELGMLMAVFSIMQFLFSPFWGALSDRYGRKPILLIGVFGAAFSTLLFGLATSMWVLFASRALAGLLTAATFPTAMAYISDITSERDRGAGMGLLGAAMGMGMVLGPGIGGWLGAQDLARPFFFASGLSVLAMVLIWIMLPETLPKEKRVIVPGSRIQGPNFKGMFQALLGPLGFLLFLAFLVNFGLANFEGIFGLYSKERYGFGPEQVGSILVVIGVVSTIIQGMLTGPATRRLGEVNIILLSLIGSALGFGLMLVAPNYIWVALTVAFFIFSNAMLRPAIASLTSKMTEGGQGMALGLNNAYQSLGRVAGPLWAGALFDVNLSLPYSSAAVIMLVSFGLALVWLRRGAFRSAGAPQPVTVGGVSGDD